MAKDKNKDKNHENLTADLGGMGLYGTTGNVEIEGYTMSGDIENAGQLDKGYKRNKEHEGAVASFLEDDLPVGKNEDVEYDPKLADHEDKEAQQRADEADKRAEHRTNLYDK
ncbi:YfhD family protein [Salipaludibacillus sp. CF4.18]|uniref:YfhD family protein n=1 Tax=Salipaludibacillus sp. CF4.18 TaxID=3373081 RepID=UPI003EE716E8